MRNALREEKAQIQLFTKSSSNRPSFIFRKRKLADVCKTQQQILCGKRNWVKEKQKC